MGSNDREASDLENALFGDEDIFCEICKLWIHGVQDIDKHFLVHSFKTWPMLSNSFQDVLKKRTENVAEYEMGLTETKENGTLDLILILNNMVFGNNFNKYFEGASAEDGIEDDRMSVMTTPLNISKVVKKASIKKTILTDTTTAMDPPTTSQVLEKEKKTPERFKRCNDLEDSDNEDTLTVLDYHASKKSTFTKAPQQTVSRTPTSSPETVLGQPPSKCLISLINKPITARSSSHSLPISLNLKYQSKTIERNEKETTKLCETLLDNPVVKIPDSPVKKLKDHSVHYEIMMSQEHTSSSKYAESHKLTLNSPVNRNEDFDNNETNGPVFKDEVPKASSRKSKSSSVSVKRNKIKGYENDDVPEKKARFQKIQGHADAYVLNRNKNSKTVVVVKETENEKQESSILKIKKAPKKLDRYTIIQPYTTKMDENIQVLVTKSHDIEKSKSDRVDDKEEKKVSKILNRRVSQSHVSTGNLDKHRNKSSIQPENTGGTKFNKISKKKSVDVTKKYDIGPLESYIKAKNGSGQPITSEQQHNLLIMFKEIQSIKFGNEPSLKLKKAMLATGELREDELKYKEMPIKDALKIFFGLRNYKLLKLDFERCTQKSLKLLNSKLKDLFEQLIDGEKFRAKISDRFQVCEKAMNKLKESPDDILLKKNVGMLLFGYKQTKGKWQDSLFRCRRKSDDVCLYSVYPFIDIINGDLWTPNKKMDLYVEVQEVGSVPGFYEAIIAAYCMYWVFNLEYEDVLRPVFEYFDWVVGNPQNRYK